MNNINDHIENVSCCEESVSCSNNENEYFIYKFNPDTESYCILGLADNYHLNAIDIPSFYNNLPVTSIGLNAFNNHSEITSLTLSDNIIDIGMLAFGGCSGLKSLSVNKNNPIFHSTNNCIIETKTKKLVLGCKNSIIPADGSVTCIGPGAFFGCDKLTEINIPEGVTSLLDAAFWNCTNLTSVKLPATLNHIVQWPFLGCGNIKSIVWTNSQWSIADIYKGLMPEFPENCNISLPTTVSVLEDEEKNNDEPCYFKFKSINDGNNYIVVGLADNFEASTIEIPHCYKGKPIVEIGKSAFSGCSKITELIMPDSITRIGNSAFCNCANLKKVVFSENLTEIGNYAFYSCKKLTKLTFPDSLITIGEFAFDMCTHILNLKIPKNIKEINTNSFSACFNLMVLTLPKEITYISSCAFSYCSYLTDIIYEGTVEQWRKIHKHKGFNFTNNWNYKTGKYIVHCTDGDLKK